MNTSSQKGFVALMTVIIVGAILLTLVFTLGASAFLNRFSIFDTQNKRMSLALAESCANMAMVKIASNPNYNPSAELVTVGSGAGESCRICGVSPVGGPNYTIRVRAVYQGAFTNLTIAGSIVSNNFDVTAWSETPSGPGSCPLP